MSSSLRDERLLAVKEEVGWTAADEDEANGGSVAPLSPREVKALEGHFIQCHVPLAAQYTPGEEDWCVAFNDEPSVFLSASLTSSSN
jgi:hypothetical protein